MPKPSFRNVVTFSGERLDGQPFTKSLEGIIQKITPDSILYGLLSRSASSGRDTTFALLLSIPQSAATKDTFSGKFDFHTTPADLVNGYPNINGDVELIVVSREKDVINGSFVGKSAIQDFIKDGKFKLKLTKD